jgi:cytochrome c oxidase cbb3-type subunit 1
MIGLGIAFYLLPKISGRALQGGNYALFGFWTFVLFAPWCGMPQTAPIPAWLPAASSLASGLTLVSLISFIVVYVKTVYGVQVECKGGPYCHARFATAAFVLSSVLYLCLDCPDFGRIIGLTWWVPAVAQLQIFGFFTVAVCAAVNHLLPDVMDFELSFPKLVRFQHWCFMLGVALLVIPLLYGGLHQGLKMQNASVAFPDIIQGTLLCLRISTLGLLFLLLGSLMLAANIFSMTIKWHTGVVKSAWTAVNAPLETPEVKS